MAVNQHSSIPPLYYVGVGASAGGLEAIEHFFHKIPPQTGLAFIVIQHLSPDYKSLMVELLSKKTAIPVLRAEEGMIVEQDTIYLIPPQKNLTIFHGKLLLSDQPAQERHINLPIDIFFRSLAEDQQEKAIGVILSGTGSDGSRGVRAIKEHGGIIMVQDEQDARFDGMPRSAMLTGTADFVLKAEDMSDKLLAYIKSPFLTRAEGSERLAQSDDELNVLFSLLRSKSKVDFTCYKPSTVLRRIERRMNFSQVDDLAAYVDLLKANSNELNTLYRELLIGVTNFFRDREAFDLLIDSLLPRLFTQKKNDSIRVWVAGCSTGEEAYSLAITLQEVSERLNMTNEVKIFATDVDNDAIVTAGAALYPESIAADVGSHLLGKYFHRRGDSYQICRKIREMVVFAQHNIINDPPFTNIDLVSCRNLLIYLQPGVQKKVLEMFNFSLPAEGLLFLGSSETTGELSNYFTPKHHRWKIYESKGKRSLFLEGPANPISFPRKYRLTQPASNRAHSNRTDIDPDRHLYDRLLKALSVDIIPLTVVVNEEMEVVYTIGNIDKQSGKYFRLPYGKMENDLTKIVHQEIAIPLTIGIKKVIKNKRELTYSNIKFNSDSVSYTIQLIIRPLPAGQNQSPLFAILFFESVVNVEKGNGREQVDCSYDKEIEERIVDLEQELQYTKENLQATIEELETSNEELQATNEELLASNEELQSTNEELQSVNEELYTVNSEHQRKIMELTELNNDIDNLLTSTEIGTIFLDEHLQVRKFTPHVQQVVNIIESDIGRPLRHLTHLLDDVDLDEMVEKVAASSRPIDQKVRSRTGRWFFMRILPYHIAPQTFAGVVLTLIEVTELVDAEKKLEESEARLQIAEEIAEFASWQWNVVTGTMVFAGSLERLLGYEPYGLGRSYEAFLECIQEDDRKTVLETVSTAIEQGDDYEVIHRIVRPDGKERVIKQVGVAGFNDEGKVTRITGIAVDMTDTVDTAARSALSGGLLFNQAGHHSDPMIVIDESGCILAINTAITDLAAYTAEELIGQKIDVLIPPPHRTHHKGYINRYLQTGIAKVIGTGRKVELLTKEGTLREVHLSIGEIRIGKRSLFTGVLRSCDQLSEKKEEQSSIMGT
nr:chemotaxis protein CheB [uncultured Desulfobulbus sp.]